MGWSVEMGKIPMLATWEYSHLIKTIVLLQNLSELKNTVHKPYKTIYIH